MDNKIFQASLFYITLIAIAFVVNTLSDINITRLQEPISLSLVFLYAFLLSFFVILVTLFLRIKTKIFIPIENELSKILFPLSLQTAFFISIFSSIGEELFFRGFLLQKFGLVFSSIFFGIIHFIPKKEFFPWTIFAIIVGFALGYLFLLTGNLLAPIISHFLINFINILMIKKNYNKQYK